MNDGWLYVLTSQSGHAQKNLKATHTAAQYDRQQAAVDIEQLQRQVADLRLQLDVHSKIARDAERRCLCARVCACVKLTVFKLIAFHG